jgi:hypothetical protein
MILEALENDILEVARQHGFLPEGKLPSVPELEPFEGEIIDFVRRAIGKEMRTTGIGEEGAVAVFAFVFLRAFDLVYRWREGGGEEVTLDLSGKNLLRNDRFLSLPAEVEIRLRDLPAPRILYSAMMRWMDENRWRLDRAKVDAFEPLALSLSRTYRIAVAMALKIFQ